MQKKMKIDTGFSFLDQKWGGIYKGGNYLIFGAQKSGKTILAIKIIEFLCQNNHNSLFLTSDRKKSLEIQSASVYFDLDQQLSNGLLSLVKINDELSGYDQIIKIISDKNPSILIIDEVIDNYLSILDEKYLEFIEYLENSNITSIFLSSVPKTDKVKRFLKIIAKNSTGIIQLKKSSIKKSYSGQLMITPNIGHFEGEFETIYKVEPVRGMITMADNEESIYDMLKRTEDSQLINDSQEFQYSNIYGIEEFKFLIESKLAVSEKLEGNHNLIILEILSEKIKSVSLCDSLRKVLGQGDKISYTEKFIYILPQDNMGSAIQALSEQIDEETSKVMGESEDLSKYIRKTIQLLNRNIKIV